MSLLILTAYPRSGTQALRSILDASPHIHNCGEVFSDQPQQLDDISSFFRFRQVLLARRPSLSIPTRRNTISIWKEYTDHLGRTFPDQSPLIDIKYNSYRHLDCTWHDPLAPPHLVGMLQKAGANFIHIERRNKRAQALSHLIAQKTGQWYFDQNMSLSQSADLPASRIDIDSVEKLAMRIAKQVQWFRDSLDQYDRVVDLVYEDMFGENSRLTPTVRQTLEASLKVKLPDAAAVPRKTPIYGRDWIENIDELILFVETAG